MSYSHAADSRLAPALQRGLERLTRAWYQRQALRIFRDQTNLSATADLSATIERALRNSRHFLLLASPGAAQSPWVRREIRFWKVNRGREKLLIALTDGVIKWDDEAGDFDWEVTNALPEEELRGWFASEPLWVNLGWTRDRKPSDLTLRHGRFRGDVATLAASLHGRSKEQIDSEDARQHRRAVWIGRAVVAALAVLLVLSGVETNSANTQRGIAQQQRNIAQQQGALATQRELEALAQVDAATSPATSLDLSLAALRVDPTAQVRQTLVNTLLHTEYEGSSQPQTPDGDAQAAAFSPDGGLFAEAYDGAGGKTEVSVWNTANPVHVSRVASLPGIGAKAEVSDMTFSPDGQVLAVVVGGKAELWSPTATPRLLATLPVPAAQAVAFAPDGTTLAAVGGQSVNGTLETWNVANPAAPLLLARVGGVYYPQYAAFSPDGRTLVTGSGTESGNTSNATISASGATRAILWDVSDPRAPRQLTTILVWDGEGGIAFGPGGKTLALTWSNQVSLWDITDRTHPRQLAVLVGDSQEISAVAFSPDGRSLVAGGLQEDRVLLWDTANPAHVPKPTLLAEDASSIDALAFVHGGQSVLASDWDGQVSEWGVTDSAPALVATLTDPADTSAAVSAVAVSPDSRLLATTGNDQAAILWSVSDLAHPTELARIPTGAGDGSALAFSPDGTLLAVGSWERGLSLWNVRDPADPRLLARVPVPGQVSWLAFTPGGGTLAGGGDQLDGNGFPSEFASAWSDLWNTGDPRNPVVLHRFSGVGADTSGALSPDGKTLILANNLFGGNFTQPAVQAWNISNPAAPSKLPDPDPAISSLPLTTLSNLGNNLAFDRAKGIAATTQTDPYGAVLWSYNGHGTASLLGTVSGPDDTVNALSFDPAGNLLAGASNDFTTTIWDVADPAQPFAAQVNTVDTGAVNAAVFSPNDRFLATASDDGTAEIWSLNGLPTIAANPVGLACQLTGGGFTRAQWAQDVPGIPYAASCP